jgi:hypothetical protein
MTRLELTDKQIKQLICAIDITENALEELTDEDLARLGIELDKTELFALAVILEEINEKNELKGGNI